MIESRYNIWIKSENRYYVYNGISGSLLRMSEKNRDEILNFLHDNTKLDCDPNLLLNMVNGRMIVPDDDEIVMLNDIYKASISNTSILNFTIIPTLACNFNCSYCYEEHKLIFMNDEVQECLINFVEARLDGIKTFSVSWFGGEPLLGKNQLLNLSKHFIELCGNSGIKYFSGITTNGYLLDESTCKLLKDCNVYYAQITLDGPPIMHDRKRPLANGGNTFWQIIRNLHHAVNYLDITIRMNIDKRNFSLAEELMQVLKDEGFAGKLLLYPGLISNVIEGASSRITPDNCLLEKVEFSKISREFRSLAVSYGFRVPELPRPIGAPCIATRLNDFVIGPSGELYKCWESVGNSLEIIGDIFDHKEPYEKSKIWHRYNPFEDEECTKCIILPLCMGGCSREAIKSVRREKRCIPFRYSCIDQIKDFINIADITKAFMPKT